MGIFSRRAKSVNTADFDAGIAAIMAGHGGPMPKAVPLSDLRLNPSETLAMNMVWSESTTHPGVLAYQAEEGLTDPDLWRKIGTIVVVLKVNTYGGDLDQTIASLTPDRVERLLRWDGTGEQP